MAKQEQQRTRPLYVDERDGIVYTPSHGIRRIAERVGIIRERQIGIVVPLSYGIGYGKAPFPKFKTMISAYKSNPWIKGAIDELSESSVGNGHYFTCENSKVLRIAEDWAEEINLDGLLQNWSRELWCTGNTIAELVDPNNLQKLVQLPLSSVKRFKVEMSGRVVNIHTRLEGTWKNVPYPKVMHMAWNKIDASVWGVGLVEALLRDGIGYKWKDSNGTLHTDYRPSFLSMMEETEDSMRKILRRYVPRHVYQFFGVDDARVVAHGQTIKSMRPEDDMVVGVRKNEDMKVVRVGTDPRSRLHPYVEYMHNAMLTALETPSVKLFLEAGFTEASAKTAVQMVNRKVNAFRRFLKREVEAKVFKPRVMQQMKWQAPYKPALYKKAKLRLNWEPMEQPIIKGEDLVRLIQVNAQTGWVMMRPSEVRAMLSRRGIRLNLGDKNAEKELDDLAVALAKSGAMQRMNTQPDQKVNQ